MMTRSALLPRRLHVILLPLLMALLLVGVPAAHAAGVIYVVPGGAGTQTGDDWANAKDLQAALQAAVSGDQLWVKAGTFKPTSDADRAATFQLKSGVALYGGFAGSETDLGQRDPAAHATILSGDLLSNDSGAVATDNPTRADNSYHVLTGSGVDGTSILDGFTISGATPTQRIVEVACSCRMARQPFSASYFPETQLFFPEVESAVSAAVQRCAMLTSLATWQGRSAEG